MNFGDVRRRSTEALLQHSGSDFEMQRLSSSGRDAHDNKTTDHVMMETASRSPRSEAGAVTQSDEVLEGGYKVYKRRYVGLIQLVLLNIVISWDWLTFSAISTTASDYFQVRQSAINWLSIAFMFAFVAISPLVIFTLNKGGPKTSIIIASVLTLLGNWIRYAGTRVKGHFGVVVFGQIIIGFAQPFVLSAPTRYSNLWFSDKGRVSATALASLANPFGAAVGQLVGPIWASNTAEVPNMVLYTSILSTVVSLPGFFVPKAPPTPPSRFAAEEKVDLRQALHDLPRNHNFYMIAIPFMVYVGFFNAVSSLLNQVFEPYGFSETDAGIAGALLIVVGLVGSAIVSPIVDRTKRFLLTIKILVPFIAAGYLALIWMPQTRSIPGPYAICALIGAASFSLLPCALEYLVLITHPVSPEISSTLCWTGGQLLGAVFLIIMDALKGASGQPSGSMLRALVFEAVICWVVVPLPLLLGYWKFKVRADTSGLTM